jgi:serine/threonine protein kinase
MGDLVKPTPDSMIGRCIDRFILIVLLGEGGMGKVYLAQHQDFSNTRCVIKLMLEQYAQHPQMLERFLAEAEATSRLKHDNIIKLENFGVLDGGVMFLRFEYLEGETLEQHLANHGGRLPLHHAFHLLAQALDALDYAHANGVVHRDLKPENLFVVSHPRMGRLLKVLDFGICKDLHNEEVRTHTGVSLGTPYYMALEQYVHAAGADPSADTYAIGIIAWQMLTGRLPWGKPDIALLYHEQLTKIPVRPSIDEMPFEVATALLRCFAVTPSERPSVHELGISIASAIPAEGRAPSGTEILAPLVRRWFLAAPSDAETLRNTVEIDRIAALLWPQNATDPGAHAGRLPPLNVVTLTRASDRSPPVPTARARPRAVAGEAGEIEPRPIDPVAARATAIARPPRVTGTAEPQSGVESARRLPRWRLALLGVAVSVVAAAACFAVVRLHESMTSDVDVDAPSQQVASRNDAGLAIDAAASHAAPPVDSGPPPAIAPPASPTTDPQTIDQARSQVVTAVHQTLASAPPNKPSAPAPAKPSASSAAATGELVVSVDPYAEVWLDNKSFGSTPIKISVRAGTHRLLLVNKDLSIEKSLNVTISANKQSRVEESW